MIESDIEVREDSSIRTAVRAESILHASDIARNLYPGRFFVVDAAQPNLVA
jgi:hypothetical protein